MTEGITQSEGKEGIGIKLLVVDDNELVSKTTSMMLGRMLGYTVEVVESGAAALEKLATAKPGEFGGAFIDNDMPEMEGIEVLRRIRVNSSLTSLPVVIYTGRSSDALQQDVDKNNGVLLEKPGSKDKLSTALKQAKTLVAPIG